MSHDVFISFSSKDDAAATRIYQGLEAKGISCWMSSLSIPVGRNYQKAIIDALDSAKVMVLVFSINTNRPSPTLRSRPTPSPPPTGGSTPSSAACPSASRR